MAVTATPTADPARWIARSRGSRAAPASAPTTTFAAPSRRWTPPPPRSTPSDSPSRGRPQVAPSARSGPTSFSSTSSTTTTTKGSRAKLLDDVEHHLGLAHGGALAGFGHVPGEHQVPGAGACALE